MRLKIYVEGGGDSNRLRTTCRKGFRLFFYKAGLKDRMPRIIASGSRQNAFKDFCTAVENARADEFVVLLVDSEDPVEPQNSVWGHLSCRDQWDRPAGTKDENVHLMVLCMESWFLADKQCLTKYFGKEFNRNSLPAETKIEEISKKDVLDGLKKATQNCVKGEYGKGRHSFDILAMLDPDKVVAASPHAERLVDTLRHHAD